MLYLRMNVRFAKSGQSTIDRRFGQAYQRGNDHTSPCAQPAEFAKPPVIDQMLRILDAR
jgi:hypothetical protein